MIFLEILEQILDLSPDKGEAHAKQSNLTAKAEGRHGHIQQVCQPQRDRVAEIQCNK